MKTWAWATAGVGAAVFGGLAFWGETVRRSPRRAGAVVLDFERRTFIDRMRDAIGSQLSTPEAIDLVTAHAAYETTWGNQGSFGKSNNAFNITAGSTWTGPTVGGPDTEFDGAGNVKKITQAWRAYPDVASSVGDYLRFLGASRYGNALALIRQGDPSFCANLSRAVYFTEPLDKYQAGVEAALADVRRLAPRGAAAEPVPDVAGNLLRDAGVEVPTAGPTVLAPDDGTGGDRT